MRGPQLLCGSCNNGGSLGAASLTDKESRMMEQFSIRGLQFNPSGHSYFSSKSFGIALRVVFPCTIQWYLLALLCLHNVVFACIAIGDNHIA